MSELFSFAKSPTSGTIPPWLSTNPDDIRRALSTKEGWRQFVERTPKKPITLTKARYNRLSAPQRAEYNLARIGFHRSLVLVRHQQLNAAWVRLSDISQGQEQDDGPGVGAAVTGRPGHGKTAAVTGYLREYERALRATWPEAFEQEDELVPVVYSSLLRGAGLKAQMHHILGFFGEEARPRETGSQLVTRLITTMSDCRTGMLALDQGQNLHIGDRRDEEVAAVIKQLMDDYRGTIIIIGNDLDTSGPLAPNVDGRSNADREQLARRFHIVPIRAIESESPEWKDLLAAAESKLILMNSRPGDISVSLADTIWDLSNGAIGVVFNFINVAANAAIANNSERVTKALLKQTAKTVESYRRLAA